MRKRVINYLMVLTCLLLFLISSIPVPGAIVWSDDFEDGNLDGWTVDGILWTNPYVHEDEEIENPWRRWEGAANVTDGVLMTGGMMMGGASWNSTESDYYWTVLETTNTMQYGTWSFDYHAGTVNQWFSTLIITKKSFADNWDNEDNDISSDVPRDALYVQWSGSETGGIGYMGIGIDYINPSSGLQDFYDLDSIDPIPNPGPLRWQNIEYTRYENNTVTLALDGKIYLHSDFISKLGIELEDLTYFTFWSCAPSKWDNFIFNDVPVERPYYEPLTSDEDETPISWPLIATGVILATTSIVLLGRKTKKINTVR